MNKKSTSLALFRMLIEKARDKKDILEALNIASPTFYKVLKKIKVAGFNVKRKIDSYSINDYRNILKLDYGEKEALAYMHNLARANLSREKFESYHSFVEKIFLLANEKDKNDILEKYEMFKKDALEKEYREKIEAIKNSILKKENIKLLLYSSKTLSARPLELEWHQKSASLSFFNSQKGSVEKILIEKIAKIMPLDKSKPDFHGRKREEVIFELYGRLAAAYLLKENERILSSQNGVLTVASGEYDKTVLFKRLLRYDTLCRVRSKEKDIREFAQIIRCSIERISPSK